eukprot:286227-Prorocentrum_minimum.AAC.1
MAARLITFDHSSPPQFLGGCNIDGGCRKRGSLNVAADPSQPLDQTLAAVGPSISPQPAPQGGYPSCPPSMRSVDLVTVMLSLLVG